VLHQHPAVSEVAIYGVPDAVLGEQVRAAIVLATGAFASAADLIAWCRANIAAFKAPANVEIVSELPRNRTGKVLKRVLRDRYAEKSTAEVRTANEMAARTPDAETIQRWIASWLADAIKGNAPCALDRPLSEYGVTSLIAVDLAGALGAWLDRPVTPTLAWHHPTIRGIASHLAVIEAAPLTGSIMEQAPGVATLTTRSKAAPEPATDVAALAALSEAAAEAMLIETLARLRG
jgi:long-chain acyl-CoA synthetase